MRDPTTWYVIADGGQARVVRKRDGQDVFDTEREFVSAEIHSRTHDMGAERPGRVHESVGPASHAAEPRQDLHQADKQNFVGEVARMLNEADAHQEFDRLILVAPAHALAWLNDALHAGTKQKVAAELQKDLTKTPNSELGEHLAHLSFRPSAL
jgi:protein required for attachment to host cells